MTDMAGRISIISAERVRDELSRTLLTDHPRAGLDLLVTTGIADHVLPELPALRLERDEHHRREGSDESGDLTQGHDFFSSVVSRPSSIRIWLRRCEMAASLPWSVGW